MNARFLIPVTACIAGSVIFSGLGAHAGGTGSVADQRAASYRLLAARAPETVREGIPDKCGLAVIASALRGRGSLSPAQKTALGVLQSRAEMQATLVTTDGHFRFHYDTAGTADVPALLGSTGLRIAGTARAFVDSAAAAVTAVYQEEIGVLGYGPPPSDGTLGGGAEYDIYIRSLGDLYGQTTPDLFTVEGGTSTTFIEIHNDFSFVLPPANRGIPALKVTLAHEFHHAIQIGAYGFWTNDVWFHEITSVWMEDVVYHGVNDYLNYLFSPSGQFRNPGVPLTSNDFIEYSRGILGKFIAKKFGAATMRHVWENARLSPPLPAIDLTLRQLPSPSTTTLGVAFAEWTLWNYYTGSRADSVTYYDEAALFPVMAEQYYDMISPSQQVSGSLGCLAGAYYGYAAGTDTVTIALANLTTTCPSSAPTYSPFTLTVARSKPDDSYRAIAGGMFMKLDVANASQWIAWAIGRQGPSGSAAAEGSAYPNPFHPGEGGQVFFPADAERGTLSVYSSGMELVYSAELPTQWRLGQRVVTWNGLTNTNATPPTGVYVFVLTLPGRTVTGKVALVRR